jgi:serine/threonine protein kinase
MSTPSKDPLPSRNPLDDEIGSKGEAFSDSNAGSTQSTPRTHPLVDVAENDPVYKKVALLGQGGYGSAWLVEKMSDADAPADAKKWFVAKLTALKDLSDRDRSNTINEIRCLSMCNHPGIIRYVDEEQTQDHYALVMEYADGGDVGQVLKNQANNKRHLQEHEAMFVFLQIALAVHYLHSKNILHRDVKCANALMFTSGLVKLADFGFSRMYEESLSARNARTFCGTPYYVAPELWEGKCYGKKADVWSCGVVLYEILNLKRPFVAGTLRQLMEKVRKGDYDPLPESYSTDMRDLCARMLTVDVKQRPTLSELFCIPYVHSSLQELLRSLRANERVPRAIVDQYDLHVNPLLSLSMESLSLNTSNVPSNVQDPDSVKYEGPIAKLSGGRSRPRWTNRYMMVKNQVLTIFASDEKDPTTAKRLPIERVSSVCRVPPSSANRNYAFAIHTKDDHCSWLQAPTEEELDLWISSIYAAMGVQ